MGFVNAVKQVINIVLVILGIILNWWALCAAVGVVANKVLQNGKIANIAWSISLLPSVVGKVEEWVRY